MAGKLTKQEFETQKFLEKFGYDPIVARIKAASTAALVEEWLGYIKNKKLRLRTH